MKITPETKKLSELLPISGDTAYEVPIYQRSFSWQEKQIVQLFNDINEEDKGYYVGNLLLTKRGEGLDIVDGQQRMITLSLFLLATWEFLDNFEAKSVDDSNNKGLFLGDIKRQLFIKDSPRLTLLPIDKDAYEEQLGVILKKKRGKYGKKSLAKQYSLIRKNLFNDENFPTIGDLYVFYEKINAIEMLQIYVPNLSDAYSVFSSLNSKGLPLTLIDLLKNEVVKSSNGEDDKIMEDWNSITNLFLDSKEQPDTAAITQFFLNNYDAFESETASSITKSKALFEYQKLLKEEGLSYVSKLKSRAVIFAQISGNNQSNYGEKISTQLNNLRLLDSTMAYPLLLFIFVNQERLEIKNVLLERVLEDLISFYVRRNVVMKPKSSNVRSKMVGLVREIGKKNLKGDHIYEYIHSEFVRIMASDIEFKIALKEQLYDKSAQTTRVILKEIERKKGKFFNKSNPDSLDVYITHGKKQIPRWSIEHILPQGELTEWWSSNLSDDPIKANEIQEECVDKIGNLTMTPYNPELGRKPFVNESNPQDSKRDYKDGGDNGNYVGLRLDLFINKSIPKKGEKIEEKSSWTEADIDRRTEWFVEMIVDDVFKMSN